MFKFRCTECGKYFEVYGITRAEFEDLLFENEDAGLCPECLDACYPD